MKQDFTKGITPHIPRNFVLALTGYNYFATANLYTYFIQVLSF